MRAVELAHALVDTVFVWFDVLGGIGRRFSGYMSTPASDQKVRDDDVGARDLAQETWSVHIENRRRLSL